MLNKQIRLDRMFHAIADGNRRALIDHLLRGPASVSVLAGPMDISLPAVMQHLSVLEDSGIVRSEKQGRVRIVTLETSALAEAEQWINDRRRLWEGRLNALARHLDTDRETE